MADINCWLQSSLERVYPASPAIPGNALSIVVARNEKLSFQACLKNLSVKEAAVSVAVSSSDDLNVRIRRVGYVPVQHLNTGTNMIDNDGVGYVPGYAPDVLFPESSVVIGPLETHSFWISIEIPADTEPGLKTLYVSFILGEETVSELPVQINVRPLVIKQRTNFPVTHWFYADALCDWYKVEPFEDKFWEILHPYLENLSSHGNNCFHVPLFTPPTDGVKRPTQLLKVTTPAEGRYSFDFSDVKKWIELSKQCGAEYFEWTHLFSQWGVQNALRIYRDNSDPESLLWPPETGATSDTYRNFLCQFLPEFHKFLTSEGLLDRSFFHLSDEPSEEHLDNYRAARALLAELVPWMKVMDALSEVSFAREGLTDIPVPSIYTAKNFAEAGISSWVYFCCGPRGPFLNRLIDTPLSKIRMSGWLFYKLKAQGFLHWGYNYWHKSQTRKLIDPFTELCGDNWPNWAHGDTFVVYPGPDGPLDSIRWEIWDESLRDYALLQSADIDPDDAMLSPIRDYQDFPKMRDWIESVRMQILMR